MKLRDDKTRLRRLYLALVNKAQAENGRPTSTRDTRNGHENHHIQTVNMGGSDHRHNLVRLTYRQHYVAHLLLSALMGTAFNMLAENSRKYAAFKDRLREALVRAATTPEALAKAAARTKAQDNSKRVKPSKHSNELRSESLKGRVYTCPHCNKSGGGGLLRWHFDNCRERVAS